MCGPLVILGATFDYLVVNYHGSRNFSSLAVMVTTVSADRKETLQWGRGLPIKICWQFHPLSLICVCVAIALTFPGDHRS